MFPFVYTARARLPFSGYLRDQVVEKFLTQFRMNLRKEKALDICQTDQRITFAGGWGRFVSNRNILLFIDKGEIEVKIDGDQLVVSYRLWFVQQFVLGTLLTAFGGSWVAVLSWSWLDKVVAVGGLWLVIYWLNLFITAGRFSWLIQNTWWSITCVLPNEKWFTDKR